MSEVGNYNKTFAKSTDRPRDRDIIPSLEITTKGSSSEGEGDRITPARTAAADFLRSLILKNPGASTKNESSDDEALTENLKNTPRRDVFNPQTKPEERTVKEIIYNESSSYPHNHAHPNIPLHYIPYHHRRRNSYPHRCPPPPSSSGKYDTPTRSGSFSYGEDYNGPRSDTLLTEDLQIPENNLIGENGPRERWEEGSLVMRECYTQPPPYYYHPAYEYHSDPYLWYGAGAAPHEYGENYHFRYHPPPYPTLRGSRSSEGSAPRGPGPQEDYEFYYRCPPSPRKVFHYRYSYPYGAFRPPSYVCRDASNDRAIKVQEHHPPPPPIRHPLGPTSSAAPRLVPPGSCDMVVVNKRQLNEDQDTISMTAAFEKTHYNNDQSVRVYCTCRKSKCLKLYCQCFSSKLICLPDKCRCSDCKNTDYDDIERLEAVKTILSRNPSAFETKILDLNVPPNHVTTFQSSEEVLRQNSFCGQSEATISSLGQSGHHKVGCKCRKSACLKKYCECYNAQVRCTKNCRCIGCKNAGSDGGGVTDSGSHLFLRVTSSAINNNACKLETLPEDTFTARDADTAPGFAVSQLKTRPGGAHAQVVDAAQHLAFLKNDSTPTKDRQTRYPSPTRNASQTHSIVTNSVHNSIVDGLRYDDHKLNTPEKIQLSIPSLSNKSPPHKINDETFKSDQHPKKNNTPLLMAAMAMTELLGGPISPREQSVVKIDHTRKGDLSIEGAESALKKRKLGDTEGTHVVGKKLSATNKLFKDTPTLISNTDAGKNDCVLYKRESAFQSVGTVTSLKPSERPLVRDPTA